MRLILRLLQFLLFVVIVIWVLRLLFGRSLWILFGPSRNRSNVPPSPEASGPAVRGGETFRDPVCGTYVSPEVSVSSLFQGQRVHFCSQECLERYRSSQGGNAAQSPPAARPG
jgi:YHS domain-containing protein